MVRCTMCGKDVEIISFGYGRIAICCHRIVHYSRDGEIIEDILNDAGAAPTESPDIPTEDA